MFSNGFTNGERSRSTAYREVGAATGIEGASPHKLVSMLYQALSREIASARGAIARKQIGEKARAISHAVRIVEEGLMAPLDMQAGGALAANLHDVYEHMVYRLTLANAQSDDAALAHCARLIETLREGWDGIEHLAAAAPALHA